jgi:DNA helicase-2/ATP-dependent DNA helicase PcrA
MTRVFREYERRKAEAELVDFEDLLGHAIRLLEEDADALAQVRDRYRAFTVDEYQDVNLLQQTLLELWLGERDELCAVGDDYQSIYAFTGATPQYLLAMPTRFPHATVVRLEANYRSSPQVLSLANRLVPKLGGAEGTAVQAKHARPLGGAAESAPRTLRATRPEGPEPETRSFEDGAAEGAWIIERVRALHTEGVPLEEMAVLVRLNARSADFEELFHDAQVPFQGAALLQRDAARQLVKALNPAARAVGAAVRGVARDHGWLDHPPDGLGERELTRQADLGRLVRLAEEFDDGTRTADEYVEWLRERFDHGAQGGVHLLTLHRAKGLEWDAVFIPRVEEKELPCKASLRHVDDIAEERRLLYVGMTRARRWLALTWTSRRPSRFLAELGVATRGERPPRRTSEELSPTFGTLKRWRLERANADEVPAYVVFHNATLEEIAAREPRTLAELAAVPGVGPSKLERYGEEVLAALAKAS